MKPDIKPIGEVLRGIEIGALDEGWTCLEAVCLVKCLDESGEARWLTRSSAGVNDVEVVGALTTQLDVLRRDFLAGWEDD